ncbi:MAG TPA: M28 family peptidase [Candidatus Sulfotelmatobacter sp.]|nr:M28 family peptidase [Candidatus Sulfotelmatobacter sp.]
MDEIYNGRVRRRNEDLRGTFPFLPMLCSLVLVIATAEGSAAQNLDPALAKTLPSIRANAIRSHLEFLADDALEGRHTGSRGFDVAARYVRAQFAAFGLKSGVADASYFQPVTLRQTNVDADRSSIVVASDGHQKQLAYNNDFVLFDTHARSSGSISAPVVFAGYGVTAKEFQYDDYTGIDARGKIVAVLWFEAPASFPATERAYYMDSHVKCEIARDHGAIGIIEIQGPEMEQKFPWEFMLREVKIGFNSMRWLDRSDHAFGTVDEIRVDALLNRSGAAALFEGEPETLESVFEAAKAGSVHTFPLHKTVRVQYTASHTSVNSVNVLSVIRGSDPILSKEFVVLTAHLDHLGIGPPVDGDNIYNGALDNAAGVSVMLEVARWFSNLPKPPARSVAFVALTGEEQDLLGSSAFANQSPITGVIVADVNVDGGAFIVPVKDVVAYGEEHSSLGPIARRAAGQLGLALSPDPFPDEGSFIRSDQYSFIRTGVPSLQLDLGLKSEKPGVDAVAEMKKWMVTIYHSPKDELSQSIEYDNSARFARFAALVTYYIAIDPKQPAWNANDFFGARFARR